MSVETCFAFCLVGDICFVGDIPAVRGGALDIADIRDIQKGYPIAGTTEEELQGIAKKLAKGRDWLLIYPGDTVTIGHNRERTREACESLVEKQATQ